MSARVDRMAGAVVRPLDVESLDERRAAVEVRQRSRPLAAWDAAVVAGRLDQPERWTGRALVAVEAGRIVGLAEWLGELPTGCAGVFSVCVVPEARGRGHGTALLGALACEMDGLPAGCAVYVDREDEALRRFAATRLGCAFEPDPRPGSFWLDLRSGRSPLLEGSGGSPGAGVSGGGAVGGQRHGDSSGGVPGGGWRIEEVAADSPLVGSAVDVLSQHNPHFGGDDLPREQSMELLRRDVELGGFLQVAVAGDDGSVIGAVATCALPFTGLVYSSYTVVAAEERGRGVGWALKVAQARAVVARGAEGIVTDVPRPEGPIARLLRRAGYRTWDRRMARTEVAVEGAGWGAGAGAGAGLGPS